MENTDRKRKIILGISILIIAAVIFYLESSKVTPVSDIVNQDINVEKIVQEGSKNTVTTTTEEEGTGTLAETTKERLARKSALYEPAKEISSPDGFINTDGIKISDLIGKKVILVDFWTYSCINCQRTLPYLNDWYKKYADQGLVIIGIHTPEFEFEKDYNNVAKAVEKYGIKYPVVLDNDYSTWRSYENRYWPRKYLIDIDGFIVYDHIGEGGYDETEQEIVKLLNEKNKILGTGGEVAMNDAPPANVDNVDFAKVGSPETYLGSARLERLANLPSQDCIGRTCEYHVAEPITLNSFQLDGRWGMEPEQVTLESDTGSIFYRFNANKVNLVVGKADGIKAEIYLDGKLITPEKAGRDVQDDGTVTFSAADLYNLVDQKGEYSEHVLEIRFLEKGINAFAFTFG